MSPRPHTVTRCAGKFLPAASLLCGFLLAAGASFAGASGEGSPGAGILLAVPEEMQPLCGGALDLAGEPYATRFPKEYQDWENSVHGRAYLSGNFEAPACTDCHDDPRSGDFRAPSFRLDIPARCARCHADETRMRKYKIATDVYDSYLADYHGWTIEYYRTHFPWKLRFEAVCSSCHRSHAVYPADDPRSSVAPRNLLETCRQCHPQADGAFASITTGHFRIDREHAPLAYYVKEIYQILIPLVIGLMVAYVGLDILARLRWWVTRRMQK